MTENRRKAREIRDALIPIRASLDQLVKRADDEGIQITHQTIQALLNEKTTLEGLAVEARAINNQRVLAEVDAETRRALQGLGMLPRRRRRG